MMTWLVAVALAAPLPAGDPGAWSFVEASSSTGQIVVLRQFGDRGRPEFGHHGEPMGATELLLFDTTTGSRRVIDEVIDVASRRWLLVRADGGLHLVDGNNGGWETLTGVDLTGDGNACLAARGGSFDAGGTRLGLVGTDGVFHVRDLASGDTWDVAAEGRLWRGFPAQEGRGATLLEVEAGTEGWPYQNTSCKCRWCGRFAMSYGFYGWSGPAWTLTAVDGSGARTEATGVDDGGPWHTEAGRCTLVPAVAEVDGLARGPWTWECAEAPERPMTDDPPDAPRPRKRGKRGGTSP